MLLRIRILEFKKYLVYCNLDAMSIIKKKKKTIIAFMDIQKNLFIINGYYLTIIFPLVNPRTISTFKKLGNGLCMILHLVCEDEDSN